MTFLLHSTVPLTPQIRGQPRVVQRLHAPGHKKGLYPGPESLKHPPAESGCPHSAALGMPPVTHFPVQFGLCGGTGTCGFTVWGAAVPSPTGGVFLTGDTGLKAAGPGLGGYFGQADWE